MLAVWLLAATLAGVANFSKVRASYYDHKFQNKRTASGQLYDENKLTAAHLTIPLGSKVLVRNLKNNKTVVVTINDRGPWVNKFSLDLSLAAARKLGITPQQGWAWVEIKIVSRGNWNPRTPSNMASERHQNAGNHP